MGIELMGAGGLRADLEAIATAVEALSACVPDFRVEIGHARFFQALADQLPLSPRGKGGPAGHHRIEKLRGSLRAAGPPGGLARGPGHGPAARLFGGEEALAGAERWFRTGRPGISWNP